MDSVKVVFSVIRRTCEEVEMEISKDAYDAYINGAIDKADLYWGDHVEISRIELDSKTSNIDIMEVKLRE